MSVVEKLGRIIVVVKIGDTYTTCALDAVKFVMVSDDVKIYKFTNPKS